MGKVATMETETMITKEETITAHGITGIILNYNSSGKGNFFFSVFLKGT